MATLVLWDQEHDIRMLQRRLGLDLPLVEVFSNDARLADLAAWRDASDDGDVADEVEVEVA